MAFDGDAGDRFESLGGRLAHGKRLAPEIFRLPREKRMAVLQGWLNGDGCKVHDRNYWQGKTVSGDLAAHLQLLAESVGYHTTSYSYDPSEELGGIGGRPFKSARRVHHLYFYERTQLVQRGRPTIMQHEGRAYAMRYVKGVEQVPYSGDVWNLTVDDCPTFQTSVGMSHNMSKPTKLFETPIELHTKPGEIVIEPFNGSGSQIIAASKLARRCYAMELQPAFVDGTIDRWQKATGKVATLNGTGQTFEEVKVQRGA